MEVTVQTRRPYPFHEIEPRWQQYWLQHKTFRAANPGEPGSEKPKFYILDMFPYPSGAGLHVGHPEGYTATDILARFKRMRGFNVLHPMGWDAFGLPTERYAVENNVHPRVATQRNIATFRRQIQMLGFSYDWDREFSTTDPDYFRWTQWIFLQLYRKGLAYVGEAPVWFCPAMGTTLANEEIETGPDGQPRSERGKHPVERRFLRQWMFRITAYAQRLLDDLQLVAWPEKIKKMQSDWIGRSEGAEVEFKAETGDPIRVFTTRPDTLFGATYLVLAPEHPLVERLTTERQRSAVEAYRRAAGNKSDLERTDLAKEKTGVFIGTHAWNPVFDPRDARARIPIWIADYVLASYGTGAIMAVPAHDERDHAFAQEFKLPIVEVIEPPADGAAAGPCFSGEGTMKASGAFDGMPSAEGRVRVTAWLEERGAGRARVNYKLRDWIFSRQIYWGEPFPIVWQGETHHPVAEADLPVLPPELEDFKPTPSGEPPLARAKDWVELAEGGRRETNVMPNWAGSCWYYLRFVDPRNGERFVGEAAERYWMGDHGVDLYVGGAEHAVLHLLYARFWHKVLFDLGLVSTPEPFHRLVNQGLILGEDGQKMSKSLGNVVNPDDVVAEFGADAFRLYEMFMGPLEQSKPWATQGMKGMSNFLARVWRLMMAEEADGGFRLADHVREGEPDMEAKRLLHKTIQKVTDDIEGMRFNTAISALMEWTNDATRRVGEGGTVARSSAETFVKLLAPLAPHMGEELWQALGHRGTIAYEPWPDFDPALLVRDEVEIVIQVNGKIRGRATVPAALDKAGLEAWVQEAAELPEWLGDRSLAKVIAVPGRLVNLVVR